MNPQLSDKVTADKITKTFDQTWRHERINADSDDPDDDVLTNTFIFDLQTKDTQKISLEMINDNVSKINFNIQMNDYHNSITFQHITQVLYNPKLKVIIFESKNDQFFSRISIDNKGRFTLSLHESIENYHNAWLVIMAENLNLKQYKP